MSHQLVLNNLGKFCKEKDLLKFLNGLAIKFKKLKKVPQRTFSFLSFDNSEDLNAAIEVLKTAAYKGYNLEPVVRTFHNRDDNRDDRNEGNKRKWNEDTDEGKNSTRQKFEPKSVNDAVAPWWNLGYEEQLMKKMENMKRDCLVPLVKEVRKSYVHADKKDQIPPWLSTRGIPTDGLAGIVFEDIIRSPQPYGYRNKCEFTFGKDIEGKESVGFRLSGFSTGVTVGAPYDCPNIPRVMKRLVNCFINFLGHSPFKTYDLMTHEGVWRLLTVRNSKRTGELIVMLCVNPPVSEDELSSAWDMELKRLSGHLQSLESFSDDFTEQNELPFLPSSFVNTEGAKINESSPVRRPLVSGFCLQVYTGVSVPLADHPSQLIFGKESIREELLGCTFEVSPQSFFQVSTLFYGHVIDNHNYIPCICVKIFSLFSLYIF